MMTNSDPFRRLPDSLGLVICQICSADHAAMRCVSRHWQDQTNKAITRLNPVGFVDAKLGIAFPHLQHLRFSAQFFNINSLMRIKQAIASLFKLKSITFDNAGSMDQTQLHQTLIFSKEIELSINFKVGGDEKLSCLRSVVNLISIRCPPEISDEGLLQLSQHRNLRVISARGHRDSIFGGSLLFLQSLPKLEELELAFSHIDGASLNHLILFLRLQRLDLSFCENLKSGELKPLGLVKTLIDLDVSGTAVADIDLRAWYELDDLIHLKLRLCFKVTPFGLKSLQQLKRLKDLKIGQNDQFPKDLWDEMRQEMRKDRDFAIAN